MKFNIGDRVRLTAEAARMLPTKATARGEVVNRTKSGVALVKWDNFRTREKYADHLLSSAPPEKMSETKTPARSFKDCLADIKATAEALVLGYGHDGALLQGAIAAALDSERNGQSEALDAKDALLREARAVLERCKSRVYTDEAPDYARHWDDYSLVLPETKRLLERADVLLLKLSESQK